MEARLLQAYAEMLATDLAPRAQILDVGLPGPDRCDLLLQRGDARARLAVDLEPTRATLYLASPAASNAGSEPFRSALTGLWIVGVDLPAPGPLLRLTLRDPGGGPSEKWLVLEWLGGRPDAVLVDARSGEVLATLSEPAGSHAGRRARGARYEWPPRPHRPFYGDAAVDRVQAILDAAGGEGRVRALCRGFTGLPAYLAHEALARGADVASSLRTIAAEPFAPVLYAGVDPSLALPASFVSPIPLSSLAPFEKRGAGGLSRLLALAHEAVLRAERETGARDAFLRAVDQEARRLTRLHERLRAEVEDAAASPLIRRKAEALVAHLRDARRGAGIFRCPDPRDPASILEIEMDPARSPSANAEALFRRARRLDRGAPARRKRMEALEEAIASLSVLRAQVREGAPPAGTRGEERIRAALGPFARRPAPAAAAAGGERPPARPTRAPTGRRAAAERFHPRSYRTRDGWTVLVGRSNEENDHLTHAVARPEDYWFHAHGCPGSHVVLRREGRKDNPSAKTIEEAAAIAAYFSKARTSRKAPVVYTLKKHVRKARGGPPGLAVITHERMIMVAPRAPAGAEPGGWGDA